VIDSPLPSSNHTKGPFLLGHTLTALATSFHATNNRDAMSLEDKDNDSEPPDQSDSDAEVLASENSSHHREDQMIVDSASMFHMMNKSHDSMTDIVVSRKQAVFGNDMRLPISMEASLGELKNIQLCKGMSKQLLSVPQLAVVNGMVSIFTETGCYTMRPGFNLDIKAKDIAIFSPLVDGLYVTALSDLFSGMGMQEK
jgi:hypothetical protein